jgi:CheY-like chemotaxis protein
MTIPHRTAPHVETSDERPPVVLVVDDEPQLLEMLRCLLEDLGFAPLLAPGGWRAVEMYERHHAAVAVALLDVRMPELDGPQTLRALRRVNPAVRAVFMTGEAGAYTPGALRELGGAAVLLKPFRAAELRARLREALAAPADL